MIILLHVQIEFGLNCLKSLRYLRPKFSLEYCLKQLILDAGHYKDWVVLVTTHKEF